MFKVIYCDDNEEIFNFLNGEKGLIYDNSFLCTEEKFNELNSRVILDGKEFVNIYDLKDYLVLLWEQEYVTFESLYLDNEINIHLIDWIDLILQRNIIDMLTADNWEDYITKIAKSFIAKAFLEEIQEQIEKYTIDQ